MPNVQIGIIFTVESIDSFLAGIDKEREIMRTQLFLSSDGLNFEQVSGEKKVVA